MTLSNFSAPKMNKRHLVELLVATALMTSLGINQSPARGLLAGALHDVGIINEEQQNKLDDTYRKGVDKAIDQAQQKVDNADSSDLDALFDD